MVKYSAYDNNVKTIIVDNRKYILFNGIKYRIDDITEDEIREYLMRLCVKQDIQKDEIINFLNH